MRLVGGGCKIDLAAVRAEAFFDHIRVAKRTAYVFFKRKIIISYGVKGHGYFDGLRHPAYALKHLKRECLVIARFDRIRAVVQPVPHALKRTPQEHILIPEQYKVRPFGISIRKCTHEPVIKPDKKIGVRHKPHVNTGAFSPGKERIICASYLRTVKKCIYNKQTFHGLVYYTILFVIAIDTAIIY